MVQGEIAYEFIYSMDRRTWNSSKDLAFPSISGQVTSCSIL
jgi:hypothetical protein